MSRCHLQHQPQLLQPNRMLMKRLARYHAAALWTNGPSHSMQFTAQNQLSLFVQSAL